MTMIPGSIGLIQVPYFPRFAKIVGPGAATPFGKLDEIVSGSGKE